MVLTKYIPYRMKQPWALGGVLGHIDFNRQVGKSRFPDGKLRELIKHFR